MRIVFRGRFLCIVEFTEAIGYLFAEVLALIRNLSGTAYRSFQCAVLYFSAAFVAFFHFVPSLDSKNARKSFTI